MVYDYPGNEYYEQYGVLEAVISFDYSALVQAIKDGCLIDCHNNYGTPLMVALRNKYFNMTRYLIKNNCDVNKQVDYGNTALMVASQFSGKYTVKQLLDKGANIEASDYLYRTPLMWAVISGNCSTTETLLENGANMYKKCRDKKTVFIYALDNKNFNIAKLLLKYGYDINKKDEDKYKRTPLMHAIISRNRLAVEFLLDNQADIDKKDKLGKTALIYAILHRNLNVVRLLVKYNLILFKDCANHIIQSVNKKYIDDQDECKNTALMYAAGLGYIDIVKYLIKNCGNVDIINYKKKAVHKAIMNGHLNIVKLMIDSIDPNKCINPIILALKSEKKRVAKYLVEKLDKIFIQDPEIVYWVVKKGYTSMIKSLVLKGYKLDGSKINTTPLIEAAKIKRIYVVKALIRNGCNMKFKDENDMTFIDYLGPGYEKDLREAISDRNTLFRQCVTFINKDNHRFNINKLSILPADILKFLWINWIN